MHPADIRAALKKAGFTLNGVGTELDVTGQTVGSVIRGEGRSARIEKRITEITGLTLNQLWPQWHRAAPDELDNPGATYLDRCDAFHTRFRLECERLGLSDQAVAAISRCTVAEVRGWSRTMMPNVLYLLLLDMATNIDLAYIITGRRGT